MEWIADLTGWLGLGTLILLEIVLGIDNLIFIAILVDKLPPRQRNLARIIGVSLALVMRIAMLAGISRLQALTAPLFTVLGAGISGGRSPAGTTAKPTRLRTKPCSVARLLAVMT